MLDANPISTPMDPNDKINPNPDGNEDIRSNPYAKLLGELQFLNSQTSSNFYQMIVGICCRWDNVLCWLYFF